MILAKKREEKCGNVEMKSEKYFASLRLKENYVLRPEAEGELYPRKSLFFLAFGKVNRFFRVFFCLFEAFSWLFRFFFLFLHFNK